MLKQEEKSLSAGAGKCLSALLLIIALPAILAAGPEVDWRVIPNSNALEDYNVTPGSIALNKALIDAAEYVLRWQLPRDGEAWRQRRGEVRQGFLAALGLGRLPERTPLAPQIVGRHDFGDYTLENVVFYSRPDFPVTANLYRPKNAAAGRTPAVLCPIGHTLDLGKAYGMYQTRCIKLVKMGFVVLVYDPIGHGERAVEGNNHHEAGFALLPLGQTVAGWMVWDSMRAIDFLLTLPEVDPGRIGITGNSGGGLNSLFTAAVDQRIGACAVAGYIFHFNNWIKYSGPHCTCTCLPELYRRMEWFEIAGLIAPRALLMMQGERDDLFPISGARIAGRRTEALYALTGSRDRAKFREFAGYDHGYYQPFREAMYGWMDCFLNGRGTAEPVPEGDIEPLAPDDPRLFCDPGGKLMAKAKTTVQLAREMAGEMIAGLDRKPTAGELKELIAELVRPPDPELHHLMPIVLGRLDLDYARLEKVYFLSEDGIPLPGLLWLPKDSSSAPLRTVLVVDDRGKEQVARSGLVQPLVGKGLAVLSVDLRGRGETLGQINPGRDNNYQFAWHSVLWGRPAAGRRAFDITRALDFIGRRQDLTLEGVTVVGIRDEVPAVLLAAAGDPRIGNTVCAGYLASFRSQMTAVAVKSHEEFLRRWNSGAMDTGRLAGAGIEADLGDVIPSVLEAGDVPDIAGLLAGRRLTYIGLRDLGAEGSAEAVERFRRVVSSAGSGWCRFEPELQLGPDNIAGLVDLK